MPNYRRLHIEGGTYFFTVVTARRAPVFAEPEARLLLRTAIQKVRRRHPFEIIAMVVLPDHLHAIWRLPEGDSDYPLRWRLIKTHVTRHTDGGKRLWQRRYWEHAIRGEQDLSRHIDYIHWNPLKHGLVDRVEDWPWSTFHRYVAAGRYPRHWCGSRELADYAFGQSALRALPVIGSEKSKRRRMRHQFLAFDEGRQQLSLIDTTNPRFGWTRGMADFPGLRDIQRIGPNIALIAFERGFFELSISAGEILRTCDRWQHVTSASRLVNGAILVTGHDLDGAGGVNVLTLDREFRPVSGARRAGDQVGLMRTTDLGTYLFAMDDHILETDTALISLNAMRAPGFDQAWKAERQADGTTLASAGRGGFMARFDRRGNLAATFGAADSVPEEVSPFFYAGFQTLHDGRVIVANWQGPGRDNGDQGRQLLEFSAAGQLRGSWSDPYKISSLQGILIV